MDTSFGIRSRMLRILMLSWLVCAVGAGIVPRFAGAENDPPEFGVLKVANGSKTPITAVSAVIPSGLLLSRV